MDFYNNLHVAIRWFLFLPIAAVASVLGVVVGSFGLSYPGAHDTFLYPYFAEFYFSILGPLIFIAVAVMLIPRGRYVICFVLVSLKMLISAFTVYNVYLYYAQDLVLDSTFVYQNSPVWWTGLVNLAVFGIGIVALASGAIQEEIAGWEKRNGTVALEESTV